MDSITLYITLLAVGFILVGTEIFVPGGILGAFGAVAWLAAAIVGWIAFPDPWKLVSAVGLLFIGLLTFIIWIRFFPKSRMGKVLSLSENAASYKAHKTANLPPVGSVGKAVSTLRPSGIAEIEGQRLDVVANGEWIEAGESIKISSTSGGHISVVKA
ncbi:MAG: hypothetical protein JXR23_05120 [Pontiellaceae bacterium]|nr:hypothetical protein [Pontiellaceae bacterium]